MSISFSAQDAASVTMLPRYSPSVNWLSVRPKRRRFSVNPSLYWTFLAFTVFATVSWAIAAWRGDESLTQDATIALLRRDTEPEVFHPSWIQAMKEANCVCFGAIVSACP